MTELLPLLIASCVRAALPLAVAWALTSLMRRASASTRHFVWTCAIVAAALVPIAASVAPRWTLPVPAALASFSPDVAPPAELVVRSEPSLSTGSAPAAPTVRGAEGLAGEPVSRDASPWRIDIATLALGIWAIGTAAILLWLVIGAAAAHRIRHSASGIEHDWIDEARALAGTLDLRRPVAVVASPAVDAPIVCGVWRPLIVLPRAAAHWTRDRLRLVVLHELAHVKRRDCLTQALAQIVCAAYWFNPLAWVAARRLRVERERACDDVVLAAGAKGSEYAGHLLDIARTMAPDRWSPLARTGVAMAHRSQLEGRLMAILDPATRRSSTTYARHAAAAAVLLVSVPVAAVELASPVPERADVRLMASVSNEAPRVVIRTRETRQGAQTGSDERRVTRAVIAEMRDRWMTETMIEFAEDGNTEAIAALIAEGANVNAPLDGDGSALIVAAREGHLETVRFLLDNGADPNMAVPGDGNPIIMAAREGHIPIVELLLARNADINQIVPGDENALIVASREGNLDMVKLLVSRGADVNARVFVENVLTRDSAVVYDNQGRRRVVPARRQSEWRSALSMARRGGRTAVVDYLISIGAQE